GARLEQELVRSVGLHEVHRALPDRDEELVLAHRLDAVEPALQPPPPHPLPGSILRDAISAVPVEHIERTAMVEQTVRSVEIRQIDRRLAVLDDENLLARRIGHVDRAARIGGDVVQTLRAGYGDALGDGALLDV